MSVFPHEHMLSGTLGVYPSELIFAAFSFHCGSFSLSLFFPFQFFMDECLQRLIDRTDSGEDLKGMIPSERISKLVRFRLEMQVPYISKWPQALSIQVSSFSLVLFVSTSTCINKSETLKISIFIFVCRHNQ